MQVHKIAELLPGVLQSASGIEIFGNYIYVVGDDLAWLYKYSKNFYLHKRITIANHHVDEPLPKKIKQDWEAMSVVDLPNGTQRLLIAASGSKDERRDFAVLVDKDDTVTKLTHWGQFYNRLREALDEKINIEALAQVDDKLIFFSRGNTKRGNYAIILGLDVIENPNADFTIIPTTVEPINGVEAGITGAWYYPPTDTLYVTLAAEDSDNAYDDGGIAGTGMGMFAKFSQLLNKPTISLTSRYVFKPGDGVEGKLESLTLIDKKADELFLIACTDNDGTPGTLYKFSLSQ